MENLNLSKVRKVDTTANVDNEMSCKTLETTENAKTTQKKDLENKSGLEDEKQRYVRILQDAAVNPVLHVTSIAELIHNAQHLVKVLETAFRMLVVACRDRDSQQQLSAAGMVYPIMLSLHNHSHNETMICAGFRALSYLLLGNNENKMTFIKSNGIDLPMQTLINFGTTNVKVAENACAVARVLAAGDITRKAQMTEAGLTKQLIKVTCHFGFEFPKVAAASTMALSNLIIHNSDAVSAIREVDMSCKVLVSILDAHGNRSAKISEAICNLILALADDEHHHTREAICQAGGVAILAKTLKIHGSKHKKCCSTRDSSAA